jgi:hypothetical protein
MTARAVAPVIPAAGPGRRRARCRSRGGHQVVVVPRVPCALAGLVLTVAVATDSVLHKVFAKLGVSSRRELPVALRRLEGAISAP